MKKIISIIIGVCTVLAFIILLVFTTIEMIQSRLANNHKCSAHLNGSISLLRKSESVKEIFLVPKIMEMPQRNEIACFVMTTTRNRNARSVIRRTWGKIIKPLFVMSRSDNSTKDFLINEAQVFDDMIVIDGEDEDLSLSITFKYFVNFFNDSQYFLYTRDDVFLNVKNLYDFLNDENTPDDAIIGNVKNYPYDRMKQSILEFFQLKHRKFMSYVDNSAFLIPGKLIIIIFINKSV